jgi:hypothetical protein
MEFNKILIKEHCSAELAIAFDPSFISKSGKQTSGAGYFWSGCAGRTKWGLEISGLNDCEARSEKKLKFHFNTSLTTINLAKSLIGYLNQKKNELNFQWQM